MSKEKIKLQQEIIERINGYVDSLFVDYHQSLKIDNGDVHPYHMRNLLEAEEEVARIVTEILFEQRRRTA